jgi:sRNA-binding regulator protein Hfq
MNTEEKPPEKKQNEQRPKDAPIIFYLLNGEKVNCTAAQWDENKYEHIIHEENTDIIIPKGAVVKIRAGKK